MRLVTRLDNESQHRLLVRIAIVWGYWSMKTENIRHEPPAVTVGVAGHTGHGKSMLIRCLTGTDAVAQPQERSLPELSFGCDVTPLKTDIGNVAALIEIPVCQRDLLDSFRGLCGVDMVILVVAADDGVMPQTIAFLNLMRWFGIRHGFIVLSRTDLVDEELSRLAEDEVREAIKSSFLQNLPVVSFSAVSYAGKNDVMACLSDVLKTIPPKPIDHPFRMWIDKATAKPGVGTVVCGTILSGRVCVDDPFVMLPINKTTKARSLEVHHVRVDKAVAGQRVGINLPRIPLDSVVWGMALAAPGVWKTSRYINAALTVFSPVVDEQQVVIYVGTTATISMLKMIRTKSLTLNESGFVQLELVETIMAAKGDRFVITLSDNLTVIGGGMILELSETSLEENNVDETVDFLIAMKNGRTVEMIMACLQRYADRSIDVNEISVVTGLSVSTIQIEMTAMTKNGKIIRLDDGSYFLKDNYEKYIENIITTMTNRLAGHPLVPMLNKEEIKAYLKPSMSDTLLNFLLSVLVDSGNVHQHGSDFTIPGFKGDLTADQERLSRRIIAFAEANGDSPFSIGSFFHTTRLRISKKEVLQIVDYLCRHGELVRISFDHYILPMSLSVIKQRVKEAAKTTDSIHLAASKEILGFGRTKGTLVFEYLDEIGFTVRQGDLRSLNR